MTGPKHPAKFSSNVLDKITELLDVWGTPKRVIDPFAGVGRVHDLSLNFGVGVEIEPEWASVHPANIVGNALELPFPDNTFDGLICSPAYGNRLADHHNAKDGSRRYSYTHTLGRTLHAHNSGTLQWGDAYRNFHDQAWTESLRVLSIGALIIINVSNHIRHGVEQYVTEWHLNWFTTHGCVTLDFDVAQTPRLRYGANRARARYENIFVARYIAPLTLDDPDETELEELS